MGSVLYAGGRLESVVVVAGSPADNTNGSSFDSAYADASIACYNGSSDVIRCGFYDGSMAAYTVATGHTLWIHFEAYKLNGFGGSLSDAVVFYDASGFPWVKMQADNINPTVRLYANTGTGASPTWTQLGSNVTFNFSRNTFDISIAINSSTGHAATIYINGAATAATGTWSNSSFAGLRYVQLKAFDTDGGSRTGYSQILITEDASTVGAKVKTCRATGAGANSGWTGAYTDVNEAADDDGTVNTTTSVNVLQTYPVTNVTVPTGLSIQSVFHWVRGRNSGSAPNNIASVARSGGTDYVSSALAGITTSLGALGMRYDTDPSTGAAWTQSGFNTPAQFGFKSLT